LRRLCGGDHEQALEHAREAYRAAREAGCLDTRNGWVISATLARAEWEAEGGDRSCGQRLAAQALARRELARSEDDEVRENWDALVGIAG
jgi:hypothetical protein